MRTRNCRQSLLRRPAFTFDDPSVADEAIVPNFSTLNHPVEGGGAVSIDRSRAADASFQVQVDSVWVHRHWPTPRRPPGSRQPMLALRARCIATWWPHRTPLRTRTETRLQAPSPKKFKSIKRARRSPSRCRPQVATQGATSFLSTTCCSVPKRANSAGRTRSVNSVAVMSSADDDGSQRFLNFGTGAGRNRHWHEAQRGYERCNRDWTQTLQGALLKSLAARLAHHS